MATPPSPLGTLARIGVAMSFLGMEDMAMHQGHDHAIKRYTARKPPPFCPCDLSMIP
jgi:hypothetical protein